MKINTTILETPRLKLLALTPELYVEVVDNYTDDELMAFLGYTTIEQVVLERERRAQGASSFTSSFLYFLLVDKATGKTIGSAGYYRVYPNHNRGEIGYILTDETFRNKGLIKEALPLIIAYGFEQMNLHRIEAFVGPENAISLKIMDNFGFTKEGHLREHYFTNNRHEDSVVFSLLKSEWKKL